MPSVIGVDIAKLSKINLAAETALTSSQAAVDAQFTADKTIRALIDHQNSANTVLLDYLKDPKRDNVVRILWPDLCNVEAQDCATDVCDGLTGGEPTGIEKDYEITQCVEASFMVDEAKFANSTEDIEKWIAIQQASKIKSLVERLDVKAIAFLHANAGYNGGVQYPFALGVTNVPAADYNLELAAKLMYDNEVNRMANPFLIDGGRMFIPMANAKFDSGNAEGKGEAARAAFLDYTHDIPGFAKAGMADRMFMVTPYAYAIANKHFYEMGAPEFIKELGPRGMYAYTIQVPGYNLYVDVFVESVCVDGNKKRFARKFLYKLWYGMFDNPTGCELVPGTASTKVSGIVEYKVA